MKGRPKSKSKGRQRNEEKLRTLIDEAVAEAHDEEEVQMGFFSLIEKTLKCPFTITLFGA